LNLKKAYKGNMITKAAEQRHINNQIHKFITRAPEERNIMADTYTKIAVPLLRSFSGNR
jgi:hypothetical protein